MDIDLFKTFIIVSKYKSISKAINEVYLTQPAITKQIKSLEQRYGVKLFERNVKEMVLTEDGKHLLDYAHRIIGLFDESLDSLNEKRGEIKGTLKMAVNLTLGIYVLPKLIKLFSDIYPDLKIEMFLDNTDNIIKTVKHNKMNFGFIGVNLKDPSITLHHFFQEKIHVVMATKVGFKKKIVSWKELEALPFIGRERGSDIRDCCEQWLKDRDINLTPKMELNNTESIKSCIQRGIGFSLLPWCTIKQDTRVGLLRVVSAPYFDLTQNYYICHYTNKNFSKNEKVFLEFLFETIESGSMFLP